MKRVYLLLTGLGLLNLLGVAWLQHSPGYMDADYYLAGALRIAGGQGLSEPFLWNYLNDPAGLPQASHAYWMPLVSFLAAAGIALTGLDGFAGGRLPFLLIAACLPPLTAWLAHSLTPRREAALLAGLLAALPSFYLAYLPTTDSFAVYMLLGALFLQVAAGKPRPRAARPLLLGLLAGLMHLARADGLLWLLPGLAALVWAREGQEKRPSSLAAPVALLGLGYLLVMGPWMLRNLAEFGAPLSPGGGRALWLTAYDDLYLYPANVLTPARWWASGLEAILGARLYALGQNLQTALAVQGQIFLAPLALLGAWRLRGCLQVRLGALSWLLTLLAMTLAFPFVGARGGFFHSGAALQPLVWALVPAGLEAFIAWGARRRGWQPPLARPFFMLGLVALALGLTFVVARGRVIGPDPASGPAWDASARHYAELGAALEALGAGPDDLALVNNPPGFYVSTGRPSIAVPYGDESALLAAASRYGAAYLLLEKDHPAPLSGLYAAPASGPVLDYLATVGQTHIFRVRGVPAVPCPACRGAAGKILTGRLP